MSAKLMTPAQVEEEFGLSLRYQEDLRAKKLVSYFKLGRGRGGKVMYERADVERFLAAHRVPAQQVEEVLENLAPTIQDSKKAGGETCLRA